MGRKINIILTTTIIMLFLTGCYKQDFLKQQEETKKAIEIIKNKNKEINITKTNIEKKEIEIKEISLLFDQCINTKPKECIICTNESIWNKEKIKYGTRIKELEYYLSILNGTDETYKEMKRNMTTWKTRYEQMNKSLHIIKEEMKNIK